MRTDIRSQNDNREKKLGNSSITNVLILKSLKWHKLEVDNSLKDCRCPFLCQDQAWKEG